MRTIVSRAVVLTIAGALLAPAASGGAGAQEPSDALVQDGITAFGALVSAEHCAERDAADNDTGNGIELPYFFCDDGLVPSGGGGAGVPVPVKYHAGENGDDWSGLPPPASVEEVAAAAEDDLQPESDNRITLDVDVTLPPSAAMRALTATEGGVVRPPRGGYPVVVFMHGCCGGNKASWEAPTIDAEREHWHHNNAWFAARGYVVVTYTARGFRDSEDRGSTGSTQLDSRRYEINDYQYLAGLLADHDALKRSEASAPLFSINPKKIAAVGGSYGGGFSWLATTDPKWNTPANSIRMRLAAAVPKYGWTDLVESLVPSGHYIDRRPNGKIAVAPTDPKKALSRAPIGVEKQSIVSGLYATGNLTTGNHTTFPQYLHDAFARLQQGEPYDGDPVLEAIADQFLNDRSAYFQQRFWGLVRKGVKVPLYVPGTWTDPLFPPMESIRFYNKLKKLDKRYPVTMYLGDYQHFVANKAKEWGDLCGDDHHVCTLEDHRKASGRLDLDKAAGRVRVGINTRINAFLDHYLLGKGRRFRHNVSATTTICAANATQGLPADEPGVEYRAKDWKTLGGAKPMRFAWTAGGAAFATTSTAALDQHADDSDPVVRDRQADKCFSTSQVNPGPGTVQLLSQPIKKSFVMMGLPVLNSKLDTSASDYWVATRLFDQAPDGSMTMVTRGVCRVNTAASKENCNEFALFGNAWRFQKDHVLVLEITQADTPFLRRNNFPSSITVGETQLTVPRVKKRYERDPRV